MQKNLLFLTILCALLYSVAFFVGSALAAIAGIAMWFYLMRRMQLSSVNIIASAGYGFVWGVAFFSLHCFWLLILLIYKSYAAPAGAAMLYAIIVLYLAFTASTWFAALQYILGYIQSVVATYICSAISFIGIVAFWENVAFYGLGIFEGYPFVRPSIPLCCNEYVRLILVFLLSLGGIYKRNTIANEVKNAIGYVQPPSKRRHPTSIALSLYHSIIKQQEAGKTLLLSPESTMPFAINTLPDDMGLLKNSLHDFSFFLFGGYCREGGRWMQSVYGLQNSKQQFFYAKQHTIPFVEKMPALWSKILKKLFLQGRNEFYCNTTLKFSPGVVSWRNEIQLVTALCSEVLFTRKIELFLRSCENSSKLKIVLLFFMNDSWFMAYFTRIMQSACHVTAMCHNVPVCYVGFDECLLLLPDGKKQKIFAYK